MIAINRTRGEILGERIRRAGTFLARLRGLLGRGPLADGEGIWIAPCRCVHTFGMSYPIDVLFLDEAGIVLGLYPDLPPARVTRIFTKAAGALELPSGVIQRTNAAPGDLVEFREE